MNDAVSGKMAEAVNGDDINAALRASCAGFRAEMIIELSTQDGDDE